jgi:hypothetical protein
MNLINAYEAPLRSFIQARMGVLETALADQVRNSWNVDISILEQQFDRESDYLIAGVSKRILQIRDEIKSSRPTNTQSPDYETRMIQYRQFIVGSAMSMNQLLTGINLIFDQVNYIIKNMFQLIVSNGEVVVQVLQQIREAFTYLMTLLSGV